MAPKRRNPLRLPGYKPLPRIPAKRNAAGKIVKPAQRKWETPTGKRITEYEYRSRKARRAGFRNYSDQRRVRESRSFRQLRFQTLSTNPDADLTPGSDLESLIAQVRADRRKGKALTDSGPEGDLRELLSAMGAPDWMFWRFWYGETRA